MIILVGMSLRRGRGICKRLAVRVTEGAERGASYDNVGVEGILSSPTRRQIR